MLHTMLMNMAGVESAEQQLFFRTFYLDIMQHMFVVVTDRSQTGSKFSLRFVFTKNKEPVSFEIAHES